MKLPYYLVFLSLITLIAWSSCRQEKNTTNETVITSFYPTSKPCTRWWWFATEIKKEDIKHQLD